MDWEQAFAKRNAEIPQNSRVERIYLARPQSKTLKNIEKSGLRGDHEFR